MHPDFNFNHIIDGIFIGNNACCETHFNAMLSKEGIVADISLEKIRIDRPFGVESYLWLPAEDHGAPSRDQLDLGVIVIGTLLAQHKKVYVHCQNGHGRAPTLVAAYLILKKDYSPTDAEALIKQQRPVIHLESAQREALEQLL